MKRVFIFIAAGVFSIHSVCGQAFVEGNNIVAAGYGFNSFARAVIKSFSDKAGFDYSTTGPIYLKYERALNNTVGLGLNLAYAQYSIGYDDQASTGSQLYSYSLVHTSFSALARLNLHIGNGEKWDPYWGIGMGYRSGSWKVTSTATDYESPAVPDFIPFGFETTFGLRYFIADNIAVYAEMGLAKSLWQAGLVTKF
jgi:opacity protein-like surface antigen